MVSQDKIMDLRHNQTDSAIPVLCIVCAARSGSTLLDRVIGMHDGFCSAGELRFIWDRAFEENQLCGCGTPFYECVFWRDVSRTVFGLEPGHVDVTTAVHLRKALDGNQAIPWLVQSHSPRCFQLALLVYGELLERLYRGILGVSRERVIVDSSGRAAHGLILSRVPRIDVHVVHLVRDPRAVAFSWMRARRRPEIHWTSENMPTENAMTSARRWMLQNAMAESLAKSAASYCRVRYEDFVADPPAALSKILAPYEWIRGQPRELAGREVVLEPTHTVSGNPMRFKHGPLKIDIDDEWRDVMLPRDHRSVVALTWPLMTRYGYPVRDSG